MESTWSQHGVSARCIPEEFHRVSFVVSRFGLAAVAVLAVFLVALLLCRVLNAAEYDRFFPFVVLFTFDRTRPAACSRQPSYLIYLSIIFYR